MECLRNGTHNDQIAKLTSALTLTQRGAILLYYGEELGMETMPPSELKSVSLGPKRPRADDRDGERTPMQWDTSLNAGFSKRSPWLPVESTYKKYSVEHEKKDPESIYSWYARLIKLRHDDPAFLDGSYVPLESGNPNVFVFGRRAATGEAALVILNTSANKQTVHVTGMPGPWPKFQHVLMSSPKAVAPTSPILTIATHGVLIAEAK